MYSPEALMRALSARSMDGTGGGQVQNMFNPEATLDSSRMSDQPVAVPGLSFAPQASDTPPEMGGNPLLQLLMSILGQ